MAHRSVQLYLYAKLTGIGWQYCRDAWTSSNKPKPHVLLRSVGSEENHPEADYFLGYRSEGHKVWEKAGKNMPEVIRTLEKKRAELAHIAAGDTVPGRENREQEPKTNLSTAIDEWREIIKEKFSKDSYRAKKLVLEEFLRLMSTRRNPNISRISKASML